MAVAGPSLLKQRIWPRAVPGASCALAAGFGIEFSLSHVTSATIMDLIMDDPELTKEMLNILNNQLQRTR
jgi:hypothetical protein